MEKDLMDVVMNPVRLRIAQYLMLHAVGTAGEMREELADVPLASLYRHLKILLDAGCIEVAEQRQVRGTTEKVYRLVEKPMGDRVDGQEAGKMIQTGLLMLMRRFRQYFADPENDPQKDMLAFTSSVFLMNDEEYGNFLQKIGELFNEVVRNTPDSGRKPRQIVLISAPCAEEQGDSGKKTEA